MRDYLVVVRIDFNDSRHLESAFPPPHTPSCFLTVGLFGFNVITSNEKQSLNILSQLVLWIKHTLHFVCFLILIICVFRNECVELLKKLTRSLRCEMIQRCFLICIQKYKSLVADRTFTTVKRSLSTQYLQRDTCQRPHICPKPNIALFSHKFQVP